MRQSTEERKEEKTEGGNRKKKDQRKMGTGWSSPYPPIVLEKAVSNLGIRVEKSYVSLEYERRTSDRDELITSFHTEAVMYARIFHREQSVVQVSPGASGYSLHLGVKR
jgi:hypothetical protein